MPSYAAWVIAIRLATGLVLVTYLVTHLANHALGLWSLAAMEAGRVWFVAFWRTPIATGALYLALVIHVLLALWSLYRRNTLRMPVWEASQLLLGLAVPPLLAYHVVGTRLAHSWYGMDDSYRMVLLSMWVLNPVAGLRQTAVVLLAWAHASIGLHFWLRLRPWYGRVSTALLLAAVLLPLLALLGFAQAGRYVAQRSAANPAWIQDTLAAAQPPRDAARAALETVRSSIIGTYLAALAGVLVARQGRRLYQRRFGAVRITYPGGREVIVPRGLTVLEASRFAGIPHASVCGGRGRCSTCRVRVRGAAAAIPAPSAAEQRLLSRVGAAAGVRLACQLRPLGHVAVAPLLPATAGPRQSGPAGRRIEGEEREIAVFFADLRGFTKLAEHKLPYDVVFILNRYFETVGRAIKRAGGVVNQFTGDGVMALFGLESGPAEGSRQALHAAAHIVSHLADLSRQLAGEIEGPLRLGMGIHVGPTVVGQMGYEEGLYLTAVGDTVHVASRLEQLTKEHCCPLIISADVAALAGLDLPDDTRREVTLRNRRDPLVIFLVEDPASLPSLPPASATPS